MINARADKIYDVARPNMRCAKKAEKIYITDSGFWLAANLPDYKHIKWLTREAGAALHEVKKFILIGLVLVLNAFIAQQACALVNDVQWYNIPSGPADEMLERVARAANVSILFDYELVSSTTTNSVDGSYTLANALENMLEGTSLSSEITANGIITITVDNHNGEGKQKMLNKPNRKKSLIATASSAALAVIASGGVANAQDAIENEDEINDVIVVEGSIRESLKSAADRKRASDFIRDSIVSEDIGRFPDTNVAESLQRIPGVTIDRNSGEGQRVTVRGFGPDFNTVLLNGRRVASSSIGGVNGATDGNIGAALSNRGFSFDVISADLIGGADVYKTTSVALQEGGIGSTINLRTLRPLDIDNTVLVTASGTYNVLGGDLSPSAFAFINRKFADDRLGILASFSYQNRQQRRETIAVNGYIPFEVNAGDVGAVASNVFNPDGSQATGTFFVPQEYSLTENEQSRERFGATATIEYEASDALKFTIDGLYSDFTVDSDVNQLANFYFLTPTNFQDVVFDENGTVTSFTNTFRPNAYNGRRDTRPNTLLLVGGNAEWNPNDHFSLNVDLSYSRAEDATDENGGGGRFAVIRTFGDVTFDNTVGEVPQITNTIGFAEDLTNVGTFVSGQFGEGADDEIFEVQGHGSYFVDDSILEELRFGVQYTDEDRSNTVAQQPDGIFFLASPPFNPLLVPQEFLTPISTDGFFSGVGGNVPLPNQILSYDIDELLSFFGSAEGFAARDAQRGLAPGTSQAEFAARGGFAASPVDALSFAVSENVLALYGEAQFGGDLGEVPWTLNAGLRYVRTNVVASGVEDSITDILPPGAGETMAQLVLAAGTPVAVENTYDEFLPSVNLRFDLLENVVLRAAYSRSLTRPVITDLAPRVNFPASVTLGNLVVSAGNPALDPFVSTNFDVSGEWYYGESSFFSAGFFRKNVDGFVVTAPSDETFQIANSGGITPATEPAINGNSVTFSVNRPTNSETANVTGFEIALQHTFTSLPAPFDGFGVQANATFVDSNAEFDTNSLDSDFALPGLGNSRNFVVFYENDYFGARVAYSVRDEFLRSQAAGPGNEPVFVEDFGQLDFRVTAKIFEGVELFVDGTNVLGEEIRQRGRFENQFLLLEETGARFSLGARARF